MSNSKAHKAGCREFVMHELESYDEKEMVIRCYLKSARYCFFETIVFIRMPCHLIGHLCDQKELRLKIKEVFSKTFRIIWSGRY